MFRPGEDADEPPEHYLKTAFCLLRRKLRDGRLLSDNQLQLGDSVDNELPIETQRLPKGIAPVAQFRVAFSQKRTDQALKRLRQRRIRDVALVLVELACREKSARRYQHLVELMDHRGLADTGIAGDQH